MTTIGNIMLNASEDDATTRSAAQATIKQAELQLSKLDPARDTDSSKAQRETLRKVLQHRIDVNTKVLAECDERIAANEERTAAMSLDAIEDAKERIARIKQGPTAKKQRIQFENTIAAHEKVLERLDASKKSRADKSRDKREVKPAPTP